MLHIRGSCKSCAVNNLHSTTGKKQLELDSPNTYSFFIDDQVSFDASVAYTHIAFLNLMLD